MNLTWFVVRGSGLAAYAMVGVATVWGLLLSTKALGRAVKAKGMSWFHESIGLASLVATGIHMGALVLDEYVEFGPRELFVPGASTWRPLAVALGVMSFYGIALVALSFYVKPWIGQGAWRAIHYLSFGTFAAVTVHGIAAGTDSGNPVVSAMYLGFSVAVVLLLIIRIASAVAPSGSGRTSVAAARRATASSAPARGNRERDRHRGAAEPVAAAE